MSHEDGQSNRRSLAYPGRNRGREGYDVDRLFDAMQREQEQYADRLVYRVPRRASAEPSAVLREEPPKAD